MAFKVGDRVECRDGSRGGWLQGLVAEAEPLLVCPDGWETPCRWEQVRPVGGEPSEAAAEPEEHGCKPPEAAAQQEEEGQQEREQKQRQEQEQPTCPICLSDLEAADVAAARDLRDIASSTPDESVVRLPCPGGHIFHKRCILQWLRSRHSCPLCRAGISSDNSEVLPASSFYDSRLFDASGDFVRTRANDALLATMLDPQCCYVCVNVCLNLDCIVQALCTCFTDVSFLLDAGCNALASCAGECVQGVAVAIPSGIAMCVHGLQKAAVAVCGGCGGSSAPKHAKAVHSASSALSSQGLGHHGACAAAQHAGHHCAGAAHAAAAAHLHAGAAACAVS